MFITATFGLAGCERAANLPSPWPGYKGSGETLTQGSAFGVAIGMSRQEAHAALKTDPRFHRTGVFCWLGRSGDYRPDLNAAINPTNGMCPVRDMVEEIWEADPSILCGICESEVLDLSFSYERVRQIKFHGSGKILG